MDKASQIFQKLAQSEGSKLHWYGPAHPKAKAIRREFASMGKQVSPSFPVATDTTRKTVTLMGYKGRGNTADVVRKTRSTARTDTMSLGKAKNYLNGVANKRGYTLHGMGKYK